MNDYRDKHCIMGMLSKSSKINATWDGFWKNKNYFVSYNSKFFNANIKKIFYSYMSKDELEYIRNNYKCTFFKSKLLISKFNKDFFRLYGKKFKEIREARNKYNKVCVIDKHANFSEIQELIKKWDEISGKKYGWQRHSGKDLNFFRNFFNYDNFYSKFFYIDNRLVGYSVISNIRKEDSYNYIMRKNDISYRNLCLYIDYKMFEGIHAQTVKSFYINWGASSGLLRKYKRKFPVFEEKDVYFVTVINDVKQDNKNKYF